MYFQSFDLFENVKIIELVNKFTFHRSENFFNFSKFLTEIHIIHFINLSIFNSEYIKKYKMHVKTLKTNAN